MKTIVGIGTGKKAHLTLEAFEIINNSENLILQTDRIEIADYLKEKNIEFSTLDSIYEEAEDFDEMLDMADDYLNCFKDYTFCVIGDIYSNEVVKMLTRNDSTIKVVPGIGYSNIVLSVRPDAVGKNGVKLINAYDFIESDYSGQESLMISEIDSEYLATEVILKLQKYFSNEYEVYLFIENEYRRMPIIELLENTIWDYRTGILVEATEIENREGYTYFDLLNITGILVGKHGCPWDRVQTHDSLKRYLLEECYEVIDAINKEDDNALANELGDILYQVAIHSKIAEKEKSFDSVDVTTEISKKMIFRHPEIFGNEADKDLSWEELKAKEKKTSSVEQVLNDIPDNLSSIFRLQKILKKIVLKQSAVKDSDEIYKKMTELTENIQTYADETDKQNKALVDLIECVAYELTKKNFDIDTELTTRIKRLEEEIIGEN